MVMDKRKLNDFLGWGLLLWFIGYLLGIIFFMFIPHSLIGWAIMPIGTVITLWVLFKKIKSKSFIYYLQIAITWTLIAVILDYLFIVKMLKPADGYYKLDVYIYYFLTFAIPAAVGWFKHRDIKK
jgi:hypothetical protein